MRTWLDHLGSSVDEAAEDVDWLIRKVLAAPRSGRRERIPPCPPPRRRPPDRCPEVGGKAASLGELMADGVRVPDGVVLSADGAALPSSERATLLRDAVTGLDGGLAVRSSGITEDGADHSFAGICRSILGSGPTTCRMRNDAWPAPAARVADYDASGDGRLAVIVQRMVAPIGGRRGTDRRPGQRGPGHLRGDGHARPRRRLVSGAAFGDEWAVAGGRASARRQPERAIDRRQAAGCRLRARSRRAAGRHRTSVGDRRARRAVDPPGQADDRAARGLLGIAGARRLHAPAAPRRVDLRAGHAALRVMAAVGDGGADAPALHEVPRTARAAATTSS